MPLTSEERATLTTRLAEAENALHQLSMGTMARIYVDQNGERVEFTATNSMRLRAYILELKALLGKATGHGPLKVSMIR